MNTTLLILCIALVLYLATCVRQWRRLGRDQTADGKGSSRDGQ